MSKKALIAMSGGVDSSAAAYLMKQAGYDCVGVTMRLFDHDSDEVRPDKACCTDEDVKDALLVCLKMDIPHHTVDYKAQFKEAVMDPFVTAYETGRTPNPCINCNRYLKFEELFRQADEFGCDVIVTGHYAKVAFNDETGRWELRRAAYRDKDQTYVLFNLTQAQLARIRFPLGDMKDKEETRAVAESRGFKNAKKHESQDICFVPTGKYTDFIEKYTGKIYPEGDFVDVRNGAVLGTHKGIIRYTVGQRKGLGLALPQPMYVTKVAPEENRVYLGLNEDLFATTLIADDFNWVSHPGFQSEGDAPLRVTAKVRYKQPDRPATVYPLPGGRVRVVFDAPERAITKGQAVVLYDGECVVGGGTIVDVEE
ncbi:MAG: tRNA 2-thiouridine(34) synthase MnmA [Clostridia bacterium]|nr:tRNA 2-thiouridine(34) synthase MnmA [Clostridia bacterium]